MATRKTIIPVLGSLAMLPVGTAEMLSSARAQAAPAYCQGFTPDACARIEATVEARSLPPYCKPGFGLSGSGLSPEQLRICYVMTGEQSNENPQQQAADVAAQRQRDENRRRAALDARTQDWRRVEADNGSSFAIDLNSIARYGPDIAGRRTADAVICVVENNVCDIMNQDRWMFYCLFNRISTGSGQSFVAPPFSVARRILDIACGQ